MYNLDPSNEVYEKLRKSEEQIHNSALLIRLLVDVFHGSHISKTMAYPIDLSVNEIEKRIFNKAFKIGVGKKSSDFDLTVLKALRIVASIMGNRLKRVCHSLRSQILSLLNERQQDPAYKKHYLKMVVYLKRGLAIADSLSNFSLSPSISKRTVDLGAIIEDVMLNYTACFSSPRIESRDFSAPFNIKGNDFFLRKMLNEIFTNAKNHCPQEVSISLELQKSNGLPNQGVSPFRPNTGNIRLIIEDDGPGLAESLGIRAFYPFTQSCRKKNHRGLGLASVLGIVRAHEGRIRFYNRKKGGFVMLIDFPPC